MKPLADQSAPLTIGSYLRLAVHLPPTLDDAAAQGTTHSDEIVTELDPVGHRVAWRFIPPIHGALNAERWQQLTEMDNGKTRYETKEVFRGPLAYIVRWVMRSKLESAFDAFAKSLKERTEQL
jgi:hypothetical protein